MATNDSTLALVSEVQTENELLTLEEILASDDIQTKDVEVPEWPSKDGSPGIVRLRAFTNNELIEYGEAVEGNGAKNANLMLVMKSAINADGSPLFTMKQLQLLQKKSAKAFNRLAREALELMGVKLNDGTRAKNA